MDDDNYNRAPDAELAPNPNVETSAAPHSQALAKLRPADVEAAFARVEQSIEQLPSTVKALELRDGLRATAAAAEVLDRHDIRAAAARAVAEVEAWIARRHPPRPAGRPPKTPPGPQPERPAVPEGEPGEVVSPAELKEIRRAHPDPGDGAARRARIERIEAEGGVVSRRALREQVRRERRPGAAPAPAPHNAPANGANDGVAATAAAPADAAAAALPALSLTPSLLRAGLRKCFGGVDFDPCSSRVAQERIRAVEWLSPRENGLLKPWRGTSYVFPPPACAARFASKLLGEMMVGRVTRAALLVPAGLDEKWAQALLRCRLLGGLVVETGPAEYEVEGAGAALSPGMALFVFGVDRTTLYEAFDPWGRVLRVAEDR